MKLITSLLLASAIGLNAQILATVNSQDITSNEVNNFLKTTNQEKSYENLDKKAQNLALHQTIEKTLLIQQAKKDNLDKNKDFLQTIEDFKRKLQLAL